jgi:hypothetical protein
MVLWLLAAIALLLFAWGYKEHFQDPDECTVTGVTPKGAYCRPPITRPSMESPIWRNRIDAEAPIGGNDADYMRALQLFYDNVYSKAVTRPTDKDVEAFIQANSGSLPGVDPNSLRRILAAGFRVDLTTTAAAREKAQQVKTGVLAGFEGKNLQPGNARDEVYTRTEAIYTPADMRKGELPEGLYAETKQTVPSKPGDFKDNSTSWSDVSPMSFCAPGDSECVKNVL